MDPSTSVSEYVSPPVYQPTVQPPVQSTAAYLLDGLYYITSSCVKTFYACFIDGNAEWKQQKYELTFKAFLNAFEKNGKPLSEIKKTFQSFEITEKKQALITLIDTLLETTDSSFTNYRDQYRNFIDYLREALVINKSCNEFDFFLNELCFYRYTEVFLFDFCQTLLEGVLELGIKETHASNSDYLKGIEFPLQLHQIPLNMQFYFIDVAPQSIKAPILHLSAELIRGGMNVAFDAQRRGNIPYALFDFAMQDKMVRLLRVSTPTRQRDSYESFTYAGEATIIPEFISFLKHLEQNNKSVLYISMQDDIERQAGSEKKRNNALKELQIAFPTTFNFIILSHDSDFYFQKNLFYQPKASLFKESFLNELLNSETFFFSSHLKDKDIFSKIIDDVHYDLFLNEDILTDDERICFIEIAYAFFTFNFLKQIKCDYLINVCKDSIDRAAIRNAIIHFLLLIYFSKETDENELNAFYTYLHAGAFLVKKRAINDRKLRLILVLNLLKSEEIKNRLRERMKSFEISEDSLTILKK